MAATGDGPWLLMIVGDRHHTADHPRDRMVRYSIDSIL